LGGCVSGNFLIDKGIGYKAGEKTKIKNITPQGEKPAVRKEQGLNSQDRSDGKKRGIRSKDDGENQTTSQMSA
jgi:hypothetical protein